MILIILSFLVCIKRDKVSAGDFLVYFLVRDGFLLIMAGIGSQMTSNLSFKPLIWLFRILRSEIFSV